jgi:hypothetical protein
MHHFEFRLAIVLNSLGYFKRNGTQLRTVFFLLRRIGHAESHRRFGFCFEECARFERNKTSPRLNAFPHGECFGGRVWRVQVRTQSVFTRTGGKLPPPIIGWRQQKSKPRHTMVEFGFIFINCNINRQSLVWLPVFIA